MFNLLVLAEWPFFLTHYAEAHLAIPMQVGHYCLYFVFDKINYEEDWWQIVNMSYVCSLCASFSRI